MFSLKILDRSCFIKIIFIKIKNILCLTNLKVFLILNYLDIANFLVNEGAGIKGLMTPV